jgi:hypothetical protein
VRIASLWCWPVACVAGNRACAPGAASGVRGAVAPTGSSTPPPSPSPLPLSLSRRRLWGSGFLPRAVDLTETPLAIHHHPTLLLYGKKSRSSTSSRCSGRRPAARRAHGPPALRRARPSPAPPMPVQPPKAPAAPRSRPVDVPNPKAARASCRWNV